jgi:hypothetical protein
VKRLIYSEKERVRESGALGKIDGKVAQEERVHLVYLISQASRLRGEARGRRFVCSGRYLLRG